MVIIAAAVLVPFGGLVAWGLSALHEPIELPPRANVTAVPVAPVAVAPVVVEPPSLPAAALEVAPEALATPSPVASAPAPTVLQNLPPVSPAEAQEQALTRRAVIEQLEPVVRDCFPQNPLDRRRGDPRAAATFDVLPDGTVTDVQVRSKRADPALTRCVTAALQTAVVDPNRGIPEEPVHHTFHFKSKR